MSLFEILLSNIDEKNIIYLINTHFFFIKFLLRVSVK